MLVNELYDGQGLGNQLWTYVVTRTMAEKQNYKFGIKSPHEFHGKEFLEIDFGETPTGKEKIYREKQDYIDILYYVS